MLRRTTRNGELIFDSQRGFGTKDITRLAHLAGRIEQIRTLPPGDAFETLENAARRLLAAGFTAASHRLRCYVLIGYPKDTFALAEKRLRDIMRIGFTPMAMLWQPETPSVRNIGQHQNGSGFRGSGLDRQSCTLRDLQFRHESGVMHIAPKLIIEPLPAFTDAKPECKICKGVGAIPAANDMFTICPCRKLLKLKIV